jgi:hypothetical protein
MMAQQYYKREGTGEKMAWDLAFEHGYEEAVEKTR